MKEWRYSFNLESVEKGYHLYFNGYVNKLLIYNDGIQAMVGNYKCSLHFDNNQIVSLTCSCKEQYCEHLAATLIAYEYKDHPFMHHALTTEDILSQLTYKQKEELLKKVINQDENLRWYAQHLLGAKAQQFPQEEYTLSQLLYQYNIDGNIYNLQLFIHQFIEKEKTEDDQYIYIQLLNRLKVFENENTIQMIIYQILDSLASYLRQFTHLQPVFFELFSNDIDNEVFLDFLYDHFRVEPYLTYKLDIINQCLKRIHAFDAWGKPYFLEHYLIKKLKVLYDMKNEVEMKKIYEEYYEFPKVREFFIVESIQDENYSQALKILNDSKKLDYKNKYLIIQYQNYLIDIYEKLDTEKYFEALYEQLFKIDVGAFDIYLRFKKVCPSKAWLTYFYQLIDLEMEEERLYDILLEEQEYTQLFKKLIKNKNRYYLEKKKNILISKCPNEFAHVYELLKAYD